MFPYFMKKLEKIHIYHCMKQQGFAVLTSTLLLSFACIIFTVNMASWQLIDNKIIANDYRNKEAFANAESGVHFVLSQLNSPDFVQGLLADSLAHYNSITYHYLVTVRVINSRRLAITSDGTSVDGTAQRQINLEVDFYLHFPIPLATVSVNGKLNLDETASVNDGCEGLDKSHCQANANVAKNMFLSNPSIKTADSHFCSEENIGENLIAENVLKGNSQSKVIDKVIDDNGIKHDDWSSVSLAKGFEVGELIADPTINASSLFEATFGIKMSQDNIDMLWQNTFKIDMTYGGNCSEQLQRVSAEDGIIFIKGDCDISQFYALQSKTSEHKTFSIGSVDSPKLVFIEGGKFISDPNVDIAVVGMLYFLPGIHDLVDSDGYLIDEKGDLLALDKEALQVIDSSIDMGAINVNGALLSEYKCSYVNHDKTENNGVTQHFSARFDKLILETLYSDLGISSSGSGYRLVAGTWRDF